jgi:hypothetical protein
MIVFRLQHAGLRNASSLLLEKGMHYWRPESLAGNIRHGSRNFQFPVQFQGKWNDFFEDDIA